MEDRGQPEEAKFKTGLCRGFLGLFGIRFPLNGSRWILLTKRFRLILLILIAVGMAGFLWFTLYYSNKPEFCESCHLLKPYVANWRTSTHNNVPCFKCHIPPGLKNLIKRKAKGLVELAQTLTGNYNSMPHAEIDDTACLRGGCHETRLLRGKVLFKGKYLFDHVPHLTGLRRGMKLRCTSCHSQIVQGTHITVTENVCFTCHFEGRIHERVLDPVGGCTACHEVPTKPIKTESGRIFQHKPIIERGVPCWKCHFDSVQGNADVPRQICLTCHREPSKLQKYTDSTSVHDWHVNKRKVECGRCHNEIRHGLRPEPAALESSCEACHSGHAIHRNMYAGSGGEGVKDAPSTHYQVNVDCIACHEIAGIERGMPHADVTTLKATEAACVKCHGDRMKGKLAEWGSVIADLLDELGKKVDEAQKALDALPPDAPQRVGVKTLLDRARHNQDFVASAFGAHNPDYATDLLYKAQDDAEEALKQALFAKVTLEKTRKTE